MKIGFLITLKLQIKINIGRGETSECKYIYTNLIKFLKEYPQYKKDINRMIRLGNFAFEDTFIKIERLELK